MRAREILRRPGFGPLAVSYGLSEVGDWLTTIALSVLVYNATHSALATTALFVCSKFLPAFAAPALTARVDRIAPRRSLPVLYGIETAGFAGMAALSSIVPAVVALAALCGGAALVARALTRAAVAAALPEPEDLRSGNALLNVIFSCAFAIGPAVSGAAVAALGASATLAAGAVVLLAMAAITRFAALPALGAAEEEDGDDWREKLVRGIRHLRGEPLIARMFAAQGVLLVFFTMVPPIEVVYARHDLGTSAAGLGLLMASWGAGAVVGSAIFARISKAATVSVAACATVAIGVSYVGMGLAGSLAVACALSAVGGVGNGMQWVAFVTAVQERVPAALQARAMSLVEALLAAVPGLGFVLGGAVAAAASARVAYVLAGAAILTVVCLAVAAARGVPRPQPAPSAA